MSGPRRRRAGAVPDAYDCYELCVQGPGEMARFLEAVHGGRARVLREDFCGSGATCRAWVGLGPGRRAIAVDKDAEPLARLRGVRGVKTVRADVMDCPARADIITATNFPIGYWHTWPDLVRYLTRTRARLLRAGVFVCDTYGGSTAFVRGRYPKDVFTSDGTRIRYVWEQRDADPLTGMVTDVAHFRVIRDGVQIAEYPEAFVYHWRLWSVPELRDAMAEAGFARVDVYHRLVDAVDDAGRTYIRPVTDPAELGDSFVVCLAARTTKR